MADEIYKPNEESFEFEEQETGDVYGGGGQKKGPISIDNQIRRYALMAVGVLIVAFAVYKLLGVIRHQRQQTRTASSTLAQPAKTTPGSALQPIAGSTVKTPVITPTTQPVQTTQTTAPIQSTQPTQTTQTTGRVSPLVRSQIQQIAQGVVSVQKNSQLNRTDLNKLSAALASVNRTLVQLDNRLNVINEDLNKTRAELANQKKQVAKQMLVRKARARRRSRRRLAKLPSYHLEAAIPGRAWLKAQNGSTLTVVVGDRLPGYGYIKQILPQQGVLTTSSGRVVRYSASER